MMETLTQLHGNIASREASPEQFIGTCSSSSSRSSFPYLGTPCMMKEPATQCQGTYFWLMSPAPPGEATCCHGIVVEMFCFVLHSLKLT